jgi:hypothetical protein
MPFVKNSDFKTVLKSLRPLNKSLRKDLISFGASGFLVGQHGGKKTKSPHPTLSRKRARDRYNPFSGINGTSLYPFFADEFSKTKGLISNYSSKQEGDICSPRPLAGERSSS